MRVQAPAGDIKPEIELLLCCARKTLSPAELSRVSTISQGRIVWPRLFHLATENGLLPLLCEHLLQNSAAVPSEIVAQLRDANRRNALRALFLTAELLRITDALRQKQIPALSYKGPVLGQLAYANPLLRQFDDLDIVVPQRFMPHVYEEMAALGYEAKFSRERFPSAGSEDIPGEYVFRHKANGAMVELHTEATLRHFPKPPDLDQMARRSTTVLLNGRGIPTFAPADTLLMLCVHGAKDFWSRLIWVADVAALVEALPEPDWSPFLAEARKYDAERMARLGLSLANAIFDARLPAGILQEIESDRVAARVGGQLREHLLDRRDLPAGVTWRSLYR
ncbi:MAG: nucleotidyltransferase family protein, partial [Candidatus Acidiferrales bacterium]